MESIENGEGRLIASHLQSKLFQVLQQMLFAATISLTMPTGDHLETILVRELAILRHPGRTNRKQAARDWVEVISRLEHWEV